MSSALPLIVGNRAATERLDEAIELRVVTALPDLRIAEHQSRLRMFAADPGHFLQNFLGSGGVLRAEESHPPERLLVCLETRPRRRRHVAGPGADVAATKGTT